MKRSLLLPMAATHLLMGSAASGLDFIRQIQVFDGTPVVIDFPIDSDAGEVMSDTLVAEVSIFQLWASYIKPDRTAEMLKLDEKGIGTFLPDVTITTSSEDPHGCKEFAFWLQGI